MTVAAGEIWLADRLLELVDRSDLDELRHVRRVVREITYAT